MEAKTNRRLKLALPALCAAIIAFASGRAVAQDSTTALAVPEPTADQLSVGLADFLRHAAALRPTSDASLLHVQGSPAAVHLEAHQTTIAQVLSALNAAYDMSYSASIPLDRVLDGTYTGSLRRVVSRVLQGYNFAIEQEDAKLTVVIFDKGGEQAIAAPRQHPVSEHRARLARAAARAAGN
ncbi:MAG TPA: hypothetical protein VK749_09390 [Xanthobacteraceae bacterium]|jgi:hypothetical protein|nr:hypothetical protein [Xanthobacteraceae bacterium]